MKIQKILPRPAFVSDELWAMLNEEMDIPEEDIEDATEEEINEAVEPKTWN